MAGIPNFAKLRVDAGPVSGEAVNRIQDLIDRTVRQISPNLLLQGAQLTGIVLVAGANIINHKLGRAPLGWFVTRVRTVTLDTVIRSHVIDYQTGAGAVTGTWTSYCGGDLVYFCSGSGYNVNPNALVQFQVKNDSTVLGNIQVLSNEASSHKSVVPRKFTQSGTVSSSTGVAAGTHTVLITTVGATSADGNDVFDVLVEESSRAFSLLDTQDSNATPTSTLQLTSTAPATVDLWVF